MAARARTGARDSPSGRPVHLLLARSPHCQNGERRFAIAPRDAALLAWLAIEGPTPRGRLAQLLWPDADAEAARNTLRQRLFQMRRSLGMTPVEGTTVLALADGVTHDLRDADDVLADLADDFGSELGSWLALQRERRRQRARGSLGERLGAAEREGRWDEALPLAAELLARDPLSEDAHRRLIRLHYLRRDRAAALLAFDRCEQMLKDDVGARPSPETLELLRQIEQADEPVAAPGGALPVTLLKPPRDAGRTEELAAVLAAWKAAQPIVVLGDPGIGKSRLLQAVAAAWRGALIVPARPGDRDVPLAVVTRLVDLLIPVAGPWLQGPDGIVLRERLAEAVPQETVGSRAPAMSPPPMISMAPRQLAPLLRGLLKAALHAASTIALLFDDWQFADEASVVLLDEVLADPDLAGLRRGYASRRAGDALTAARVAALSAHLQWHRVTLQALGALQVVALIESLGLPGVDAPALAQDLWQRVGGNPLYLLETLRHQHELGRPLRAAALAAPPRVRDLVTARVAELPSVARQLLHLAAIAGPDFGVELAEAVSGRHVLALTDDWALLERAGLFDSRGIAHDLHAEGALAVLPAAIGRTLHGRVAAWLETRAHEPARLAAHWRAAGDDARALPHLLAAARQTWAAALGDSTFALFRDAAAIALRLGDADRAFDIWIDTADAASAVGTVAQVRECAEALRTLACTPGQRLRAHFIDILVDWVDGRVEQAITRIAPLLGEAIALRDARIEGEIRLAIAQHAVGAGHFDEAVQQLAAAARLIADIGQPARAASIAANIGQVLSMRGQPRRALAQLRQYDYPLVRDELTTQATEVMQHARLGDVQSVLTKAPQIMERARQVSLSANDGVIMQRDLVEALRSCGAFEQALQVCEELAPRLDTRHPHGPLTRATLYLQLGRADLARPQLERVADAGVLSRRVQAQCAFLWLQVAAIGGNGPLHWPVDMLANADRMLVAEWLLWSGLAGRSPWPLENVAAQLQRLEEEQVNLYAPLICALLAWRLAQGGDLQSADAHLARLPSVLTEGVATMPYTALYAARALRLLGRIPEAVAVRQRGVDWLKRAIAPATLAPFRDSFLQRHPLHRALLTEAARRTSA